MSDGGGELWRCIPQGHSNVTAGAGRFYVVPIIRCWGVCPSVTLTLAPAIVARLQNVRTSTSLFKIATNADSSQRLQECTWCSKSIGRRLCYCSTNKNLPCAFACLPARKFVGHLPIPDLDSSETCSHHQATITHLLQTIVPSSMSAWKDHKPKFSDNDDPVPIVMDSGDAPMSTIFVICIRDWVCSIR